MDVSKDAQISSIQQQLEGLSLEPVAQPGSKAGPKLPPTLSTFPPELLLEIFHFLWEEDQISICFLSDSHLLQRHMCMTIMPHSVSNVCTYWDAVCALEPKFWNSAAVMIGLVEDADSSTHCPSPSSRLDRHLSRITETENSIGIDVHIKSCPGFEDLKFKEQSEIFAKSYKAFKGRWPGKKEVQERGERKAVQDVACVLNRYSGKVKLRALEIGTFISTSLPSVQALNGRSPDLLSQELSNKDSGLVTEPNCLLPNTLRRLKIEAYWTPLTYAPYQSLTDPTPGPSLYPNPCAQFIPVKTIFEGLTKLSLSGHTFVSFARQYLSTSDQQTARVVVGDPPELSLKILTLRPEDGGSEHPFTLTEFLMIIRLFCGKLSSLSLDDVRLPLPEGIKAEDYDWTRCTGDALPSEDAASPVTRPDRNPTPEETASAKGKHQLHILNLSYVQLTHVNGPLVYGIEQLFKGHWDFAKEDPVWLREYSLTTWWRVKEEDFETLDNLSSEKREKIKEDAKRDYTIYDKEIITSVTWKRVWKTA